MPEYPQLEYHRRLRIEANNAVGIFGALTSGEVEMQDIHPVDIVGEVTVKQDLDKLWTMSFNLRDRRGVFADMGFMGRRVSLVAGYWDESPINIFDGIINNVVPAFPDNGKPEVSFQAYDNFVAMNESSKSLVFPIIDFTVVESYRKHAYEFAMVEEITALQLIEGLINIYFPQQNRKQVNDNEVNSDLYRIKIPPEAHSVYTHNSPVAQEHTTDWQFLLRLAKNMKCRILYEVVPGKNLKKLFVVPAEEDSLQEESRDIEFIYHNVYMAQTRKGSEALTVFEPFDTEESFLERAFKLTRDGQPRLFHATGINLNMDMAAVDRGYMEMYEDESGKKRLKRIEYDTQTKQIVVRTYTFRSDAIGEEISNEEVDEYLKNFKVGEGAWEDTSKFWKEDEIIHTSEDSGRDRAFVLGWTMGFTTRGSILLRAGYKYLMRNIAPFINDLPWTASGIIHHFGDKYTCEVELTV